MMIEYLNLLKEWAPDLLSGTIQMLKMALSAYLVALVAGVPLAVARSSSQTALWLPARIYIDIMRGTPLLVQLFLIYYALPAVGIVLPAFEAAVIGIGLYYAAYMAQAYRAGVGAVDKGQREAAQAIGLRREQWFPRIVLPQSIPIILPAATNYLIWIIQDTAIASLIAAPELMLVARNLASDYFLPLEIYVTAGTIYLLVGIVLAQILGRLGHHGHSRKGRGKDLSHMYW